MDKERFKAVSTGLKFPSQVWRSTEFPTRVFLWRLIIDRGLTKTVPLRKKSKIFRWHYDSTNPFGRKSGYVNVNSIDIDPMVNPKDIMPSSAAKIKVIGVGGGGGNAVKPHDC